MAEEPVKPKGRGRKAQPATLSLFDWAFTLYIPQPNTDGLWSPHDAKEPIAVIVHRGNLQYPNHGDTELWLNPNCSYSRVPLPLLALKVYSAVQKIWTRPAASL